jgi:hypothetical protein
VNHRFDRVDTKFDRVDARFERLEARLDTTFFWLIGFQFTTLIGVIAALLNVYFR